MTIALAASAAVACGETESPYLPPPPGAGGNGGTFASDTGGTSGIGGSTGGTTGGTSAAESSASGGSAVGGTGGSASTNGGSGGGTPATTSGDNVSTGGTRRSDEDDDLGLGGAAGQAALGESCAEVIEVEASGAVFSGPDFADFSDDIQLTDPACSPTSTGSRDVVFEVSLAAGEELSVVELGELSAAIDVLDSCAASAACLAAGSETLVYTADTAKNVYVVVHEATDASLGAATGYAIYIDIDRQCGNGVLEAEETCDDGGVDDGDGCSAACSVEDGWQCAGSPSDCQCPSLGSYAVGDSFQPFAGSTLGEGESEFRCIAFTERVILDLQLTVPEGDPDFYLSDEAGNVAMSGIDTGELEEERQGLEAGNYLLEVEAYQALTQGYTLALTFEDPGACGDGALEPEFEACDTAGAEGCSSLCEVEWVYTCTEDSPSTCTKIAELADLGANQSVEVIDSAPLGGRERSCRILEVTEDVLLSGSVVPGDGSSEDADPDLYIETQDGEGPGPFDAIGNESFSDVALAAGIYKVCVEAWRELDQGFVLTLSTSSP